MDSSTIIISNIRDVWLDLLLTCCIEIPVFDAMGVDPGQTPRPANVPFMGRFKWVNIQRDRSGQNSEDPGHMSNHGLHCLILIQRF